MTMEETAGTVLGEEARETVVAYMINVLGADLSTVDAYADEIITALDPHIDALLSAAREAGAADERRWREEHGVVSINVDILKWWLQALEKGDPAPVRAELRGYIGQLPSRPDA